MRYDEGPNYPSQPETVRSYFDNRGCHIHGHPSSGGILIKRSANLVDLQHLSLPRLAASQRSPNAREEDAFCQLLKRLGASWWKDEAESFERSTETMNITMDCATAMATLS